MQCQRSVGHVTDTRMGHKLFCAFSFVEFDVSVCRIVLVPCQSVRGYVWAT